MKGKVQIYYLRCGIIKSLHGLAIIFGSSIIYQNRVQGDTYTEVDKRTAYVFHFG